MPESASPIEHLQAGMDYLRRFRDSLKDRPDLWGEPLSSYRLTSEKNIPIAVPPDWTLFQIVDSFLQDYDSGFIDFKFDDTSSAVGSYSSIVTKKVDGPWERLHVTIKAGQGILIGYRDNYIYQESDRYWYRGRTDITDAYLILHELTHGLQELAELEIINALPPEKSEKPIENIRGDYYVQTMQKVREKVINDDPDKSQTQIDLINEIPLAESQAHGISFQFIYNLGQLNNSEHFPGTRNNDPTSQIDIARLRERYPGFYIQNWLDLFKRTVIANHNALDPEWLVEMAGKEYPDR